MTIRLTREQLRGLGLTPTGKPSKRKPRGPRKPRDKAPLPAPATSEPGPWVVSIPGWTPVSLNRLVYRHWASASRIKAAAMNVVVGHCLLAGVPRATGRRRVSIAVTVTHGGHLPDADNLWKGVLDGLKHAGALIDDSAEWCELGTVRSVVGEAKGTVLTLEDIGG